MKGREDRTRSAAAFTITHGEKAQPLTERGPCKHCGRFRHDESSCFEIIGYPSGWGSYGKGRGRERGLRGGRARGSLGRGGGREAAYSASPVSGQYSFGQQAQEPRHGEQSNGK